MTVDGTELNSVTWCKPKMVFVWIRPVTFFVLKRIISSVFYYSTDSAAQNHLKSEGLRVFPAFYQEFWDRLEPPENIGVL